MAAPLFHQIAAYELQHARIPPTGSLIQARAAAGLRRSHPRRCTAVPCADVLVAHNSSAGAIPRPSAVASDVRSRPWARSSARTRLSGRTSPSTGITASSQLVRPGDLFAALPGRNWSRRPVRAGCDRGRRASQCSPIRPVRRSCRCDVPALVVPDVRAVLGPAAAAVYGEPSRRLSVLGVTGTSGKTTTTFLIRAGLAAAGVPTGADRHGRDADRRRADQHRVHHARGAGAAGAARGHGASAASPTSRWRCPATRWRWAGSTASTSPSAAFTNLSQDHLDFHADMDDYFAAKATLFDGRSRVAVIVIDDEWGRRLAARVGPGRDHGEHDRRPHGDLAGHATSSIAPDGTTTFPRGGPGRDFAAGTAIPGSYNVANALLALAMLDAVGVDPRLAAPAVAAAGVPGRMERIDAGQPFLAVVDYSHKPAAVEGALRALRPLTPGRLIIVLGCGGDRDRAKRPIMGEVAARDADLLIVTDDNPRSEDPAAIRRAMLDGAGQVPAAERGEVRRGRRPGRGDRRARSGWRGRATRCSSPARATSPARRSPESCYPFDDRDVAARECSPGRLTRSHDRADPGPDRGHRSAGRWADADPHGPGDRQRRVRLAARHSGRPVPRLCRRARRRARLRRGGDRRGRGGGARHPPGRRARTCS